MNPVDKFNSSIKDPVIPSKNTQAVELPASHTQSPSEKLHAEGQHEIFSNPVVSQDKRKEMLSKMLFSYCQKGDEKLVLSILNQGADVKARNENDQTPLHVACQFGHLKVVQLLVQNGASVVAMDSKLSSPLLLACEAKHQEIVKFLMPFIMESAKQLSSGISTIQDEDLPMANPQQRGITLDSVYIILAKALLSDHRSFKTYLEKLKQSNIGDELGLILVKACSEGNLKLVKALIDEKVDINCRGDSNFTPLHIVCQEGRLDILQFLLKHKQIALNTENDQGLYPIQIACGKGNHKIVAELLNRGALLDNAICNSLHHAIVNGKINVAKCIIIHLIENGNDLNLPLCQNLAPPLHLACQYGKFEIVSFLLRQKGININEDYEGFYPIQVACLKGHSPIVEELLKKNANLNNDKNRAIFYAIASGKLKAVECIIGHLIKNGTDLNAPEKPLHDTPFHYICYLGNMELAKLFLKYKDKYNILNVKNSLGITPLHRACLQGHVEIIKLLLANNVDTKIKAIHQFTALHTAVFLNQTEVVQVLLDSKKFDFFETTENGFNALDIAYENQNASMLKLYEKYGIHLLTDGEFLIIQNDFIKFVNEPEMSLSEDSLSDEKIIITDPLPPSIEVKSPIVSIDSPSPVSTALPTASITKKSKRLHKEKKPTQKPAKTPQYVVEWHDNFKWPKSLNSKLQGTVMQHLRLLKNWPNKTGLDLKKMAGVDDVFRLRVGQHRVLFSVDKETQKIKIHSIGLRKNVYKNLNSNFIKK